MEFIKYNFIKSSLQQSMWGNYYIMSEKTNKFISCYLDPSEDSWENSAADPTEDPADDPIEDPTEDP